MNAPVIPINRAVCVTCAADLAALGERECSKCLLETRFGNWLMRDEDGGGCEYCGPVCYGGAAHHARVEAADLPPGLRFVGNGATGRFEPVGYRPSAGDAVPVYEDPQFAVPRITEALAPLERDTFWQRLPKAVPQNRSREAEAFARRVTTWVGLLVLFAFVSGWMLGRFG